jgi:hypothetical protein
MASDIQPMRAVGHACVRAILKPLPLRTDTTHEAFKQAR